MTTGMDGPRFLGILDSFKNGCESTLVCALSANLSIKDLSCTLQKKTLDVLT